jgi:glycosyltransferase involved in cell wall biosynthesis
MRIGIDISAIVFKRGVSRYTSNLVRALAQEFPQEEIVLFGTSWRRANVLHDFVAQLGDDVKRDAVIKSYPPKALSFGWQYLGRPTLRSLIQPPLDVFHSWDWIQPPDPDLPLVSTIHDLAILKFPDTAHPDILAHHRRSWQILKERNAHVVVVSQAVKRDCVELLGFDPAQLHVVHEAIPLEWKNVAQEVSDEEYQQRLEKLHLTKPFFLFVGTTEPRKNLKRAIESWQPLADDVDFLIAGATGWDESLKNLNVRHQPRWLGPITDKTLLVLYHEALGLFYPSLDEGFGLPLLEAFHFGTPVVTSDIPPLREVGGNAAVYADPSSVEALTHALQTVRDESDSDRHQRLQRMLIRVQQFSWTKTAHQTMAVYRHALA